MTDQGQKMFETAMGMSGYAGSPAQREGSKNMKPQHTPTPWHVEEDGLYIFAEKHLAGMDCQVATLAGYSGGKRHVNAALIVRAVNAHEAMISALQDAETEIENLLEDFCQDEGPEADSSAQETLKTIKAALKTAKGEV